MKVLCASMPGAGHAHPMLAVATALRARGHHVTFASATSHADDAARAGVVFEELPPLTGSARDALKPYEDAARLAAAFAPTVARIAPDVAVIDVITLGAAWAAEIAGVPRATLCIHPLHAPSRVLAPFGYGRAPRWPRDARLRRHQARTLDAAREAANAARARLGLPAGHGSVVQLDSDVLLVAVDPCLEPPRPDWPSNAVIIGSCPWGGADGFDPGDPDGEGPLVLIAPTTAHARDAFIAAARQACAAVGARTIGADGAFIDHDAVLPRCDAVISNGGGGIMARALIHGIPHVVVPLHGDQRENAYRVARAGAGVAVHRVRARPIARALRAAMRMDLVPRASDGPVQAALQVEALHARRTGATVTRR